MTPAPGPGSKGSVLSFAASISPSQIEAIVVAHDSAEALPACLSALAVDGCPVLVVDNASGDGSADLAARLGARVLRLSRNEGYGRANNAGARSSVATFLLILNPDVALDPGAVAKLLAAAERYPEAGLLAPRLVEPDGRVFLQARSLLSPYLANARGVPCRPEGDACAPFLSGACLLVRRDLFLRLGGFDPAIFLFYEDDDLCRRVVEAGHSLVHVDGAVAQHLRGRSTAKGRGRIARARWHLAWSASYVARKWGLPDPALRIAALNGAKTLLSLLTGRRSLVERYGGSAAGAFAAWRGRRALDREGLS